MNPITSYIGGIYSAEDLQKYILETCENHKRDGRAVAFAFIVFNFSSPAIGKVLRDIDYWNALNEISGKYLTVFYLNYIEDKHENNTQGHIGLMSSIDIKESFRHTQNESVSKILNLEKNPKTPFVLFFQADGKIISDSFIVSLKADKVEDSFLELNQHIKNAVDSLKFVSSENYQNSSEVFNLIKNGVMNNGKMLQFFRSNISTKVSITAIIQLIKYLVS
nr:hypothetical protein BHI3_05100 [Bacteriovorax sp. HI3]